MKSKFVLNWYSYDKDYKIGFEYKEIDSDIIPINNKINIYRKLYVADKNNSPINSFDVKLTGTIEDRIAELTENNFIMKYTIALSNESVSEIERCIKEIKSSKNKLKAVKRNNERYL